MRLSIKKFSLSCAIIWGLCIFLISIANMIWPEYGVQFLKLYASVYPGYEAMQGISSVIIGTLYGVFDAAIIGALFAWVYNLLPE